ncbi:unnamed protein product [Rhizoctonia solani]|uniref:Gfo/Idh/MocA-like oxidoreductase N-terminal domain-containing protein n=1 Tax=Rhizoctonia solani TaxID=456999 RepID=A0A8H3B2I1_9AGAM|nr:unnamed protein product [Rhizoctonia solani]
MDSLRKTIKSIGLAGKSSAKPDPDFAPATEPIQNQILQERPPIGPPVRLAVIGAGQRGKKYGTYALNNPEHCTVSAIAEPRPETRECMAQSHQLNPDRVFNDWKDLLAAADAHDAHRKGPEDRRYVDGVIVTVQDHMHAEVVIPFAQRGYHILCEKPMATTPEACIRMADEVEKSGVIFGIAHVLRYSKYNQALREVIASGSLGKLVNVVHVEPVGHYHFAHSYVRGNWNQEAKSSFSLMTKSCHDIDLLCHFFAPATPVRFSSFGSLNHFIKSEKPVEAGSATRCLDCPVEQTCPYSASRIYLTGNTGWPVSAIVDGAATREKVMKELQDGPYGLCVYESPNDVVNIEFSNGTTASFTMVAFTKLICERQTRIHLTHGEVVGDSNVFTTTNFRTNETERHRPSFMDAHGDGDVGVVREFVRSVSYRLAKENNQSSEKGNPADDLGHPVSEVLRSHLAVFCAEKARRTGSVVLFEDFEREVRQGMANSAHENGGDNQAGPKANMPEVDRRLPNLVALAESYSVDSSRLSGPCQWMHRLKFNPPAAGSFYHTLSFCFVSLRPPPSSVNSFSFTFFLRFQQQRPILTIILSGSYDTRPHPPEIPFNLVMGDVCTDTPTRTIFATSTSQAVSVSQSTSESVSVAPGSVVTRSVQSGTGTEWVITESTVPGTTQTVQVEVPVTVSGEQQVFTVPVSTLYAPCTSSTTSSTTTSTTPTSTSTSTTPTSTTPTSTSTTPTSTETTESRTSTTEQTTSPTSRTSEQQNTNTSPTATPPTPTPTPTPPPTSQGSNSVSQTGTLTTISSFSTTTLPNGSQSTVVVVVTSSIPPSGGLNGNDSGNSSSGSSSNSTRAVAIGVGVTGAVVALIILVFGITWHIRRKRRNAIPLPLDESDIWGTHHEAKTPLQASLPVNNHGAGYTYNPYGETRTTAYAPVPTVSPPRARPMVLAESDDNRLSAGSYGPQPTGVGPTAPLLGRTKTVDEILYAAAREDLPKSRASSATASHHTRPSETGFSHGQKTSFAASHKTHGSSASRASGSAVGLLDHPPTYNTHGSQHGDEAEPERPTSPVSIAAPRLAIVNPDLDKDS